MDIEEQVEYRATIEIYPLQLVLNLELQVTKHHQIIPVIYIINLSLFETILHQVEKRILSHHLWDDLL